MKKKYTIFEQIHKATLIFSLTVTNIVILLLIWQIDLSFNIKFVIELFMAILLFVFSLFVVVIDEIPRKLPRNFDKIKNKIATGEIYTLDDFCQNLNAFFIEFFNYISFDIAYISIKIKDHAFVHSNIELEHLEKKMQQFSEQSKQERTVFCLGKMEIEKHKYHAYIIPIHFGNEWLGFITLFAKSALNKAYLDLLNNFEDDYIDDQLVHILKNK